MMMKEDEILEQSAEDLLKAQIKRHKEKSKAHLDRASELQKQLDLLQSSSSKVKVAKSSLKNVKKKSTAVSHSQIEISKPETEAVLLQNPDKTYRTEELIQALKPEYLNTPEVRRVAINKMSQILNACISQGRVSKYNASGKGNKYGIRKSYLEKKAGSQNLFSPTASVDENKKPLVSARG
jgi:hypothetical protein